MIPLTSSLFSHWSIPLSDPTSENKKLKQEAVVTERKLAEMNEGNNQLENRLNSLEQHHRSAVCRYTVLNPDSPLLSTATHIG
jgi:hypothetical protein